MPFYGKMVRIFERIRELLPDEIKFNPDELSTAIHFQLEGFANYPPDIFDTLTKGIKDSWAIEIEYSAITNEQKTRRIIQPYFIFNKHGDWYVYAFCKLRGEYRLFALHRIKTAKLTNEIFLKKKIDPKKVIGEHLDQPTGKGKYDVEIFIKHPTSLYVSERQLHSTQKIVNHHDGSLTISFTVNSLRETTRWILSMGSDAIVKKPKLLQNIIKEEIEIMVENYSK
jgi:predicted DNA-binding transcriptional regulator YafY